jgi:hypothetical protein
MSTALRPSVRPARPIAVVLRTLALVVSSVCAAMLQTGCASDQTVARFGSVAPGMSKDEVVALLGAPSSRWTLVEKRDGLDGERLQWGDGLSSLASSAVFEGDPDRAYSVVFDAEGKVVSRSAPRWVEDEAAHAERLRERRAARGEP